MLCVSSCVTEERDGFPLLFGCSNQHFYGIISIPTFQVYLKTEKWKRMKCTHFQSTLFSTRTWSYKVCCLSPADGGISDALLCLEWLIALALTTSMPSMPDVFESHPEALNSRCVLYSELKSLTLDSITLKNHWYSQSTCVCQVFLKPCLSVIVLQLLAMFNHHI